MKPKRPRIPAKIAIGQLVRSTNTQQQACIRVLTIEHHYNVLSYKRIKRVVINN